MKKLRTHIARFLIVAVALIGCYLTLIMGPTAGADSTKNVAAPPPDLQGPAAIRHLEQAGLYNSLSAAMTAARYRIEERKEGGHQAANPRHGYRTEFTRECVELRESGGKWRMGMRLTSYGYGDLKKVLTFADCSFSDQMPKFSYLLMKSINSASIDVQVRRLTPNLNVNRSKTPLARHPLFVRRLKMSGHSNASVEQAQIETFTYIERYYKRVRRLPFAKMSSDSKMQLLGLMYSGSTTLHPLFQIVKTKGERALAKDRTNSLSVWPPEEFVRFQQSLSPQLTWTTCNPPKRLCKFLNLEIGI